MSPLPERTSIERADAAQLETFSSLRTFLRAFRRQGVVIQCIPGSAASVVQGGGLYTRFTEAKAPLHNTVGQLAIITGIGIAFLLAPVWRIWLAVRSRSWSQVQGTVVNSYVMTTKANMSAGRSTGHSSYLEVVYRYTAGGKTHESKRWTFDSRPPKYGSRSPISGKRMWHEPELLAAYPEGSPITVYYDPRKPASSVIKRSLGLITYLMLLLGIYFALLGGVQLVDLAWIWVTGHAR